MIVLIFGLPGSGKTTLSNAIVERTNAVHLNADAVRATLNSDLSFSKADRIENARRLGATARLLSAQGFDVVVDFVNPTAATREAFGTADFTIWVNRIEAGRFPDTNALWEIPESFDLEVREDATVEESAAKVFEQSGLYDWRKPSTLLLGRFQPWHEGHDALYTEALDRTGQVVVAVRDTQGTSPKDPMSFQQVVEGVRAYRPNALVVKVPNITNVLYGRDVGYKIERVDLSPELQAISATQKRAELGL